VPRDRGVLRAAVPQAERDLHAVGADPERDDAAAALQIDPVKHQRGQPHVGEAAAHQRAQVLGRAADKLARHAALRRRALRLDDLLADRLTRASEPARRDAREHLLEHHARQRVAIGEVRVRLERDLTRPVRGPDPRAIDGHATTTERHLTLLAAVTHRRALRIMAALRPHDLLDLFGHQLPQHAEPNPDTQRQQALLGRPDQLAERLLHPWRQRHLAELVGPVLYGPHSGPPSS
jgi:hypothetical protein